MHDVFLCLMEKRVFCVYNATHLASAMEINKFVSAALGLVRFLF
jgi:hypothetical protein